MFLNLLEKLIETYILSQKSARCLIFYNLKKPEPIFINFWQAIF